MLLAACLLNSLAFILGIVGPSIMWYEYKISGGITVYDGTQFQGDVSLAVSPIQISASGRVSMGTSGSVMRTINVPSFGTPGAAMVYIGSIFSFITAVVSGVAAYKLRLLSTAGVMPPAPGFGSDCGCYPSIPVINGTGELSCKDRVAMQRQGGPRHQGHG